MDLLQTPPVVSSCFCGSPSASPGHLTSWLKIHWARIIPIDFGMFQKKLFVGSVQPFFLDPRVYTDWSHILSKDLASDVLLLLATILSVLPVILRLIMLVNTKDPSGCRGSWGCWRYPTQSRSWVLKVRRERPSADYAHCIFTLRQMTHVANGLSYLHLYGRTCLNILIYIYTYWWSCYY